MPKILNKEITKMFVKIVDNLYQILYKTIRI